MLSAICFNLDQSKILSSGNGLMNQSILQEKKLYPTGENDLCYCVSSELEEMKPKNCTAKLELLGKYDPEGELVIRDPYYVSTVEYVFRDHPREVIKVVACSR